MTASNNYPAEFYGKLVSTDSVSDFIPVFQLQECPFIGKRCIKQRKSDSHQTIGACTVRYQNEPLMICPLRFVQGNQIFRDCIQLLKPDLQYFVVPEVAMPGGSIDYFLVALSGKDIVDYAGIEIQSLDTTGSGGIWQARQDLASGHLSPSYSYGINWKMSAKTILVQMLHKASSFEALGKKLVLVLQMPFFDYLVRIPN